MITGKNRIKLITIAKGFPLLIILVFFFSYKWTQIPEYKYANNIQNQQNVYSTLLPSLYMPWYFEGGSGRPTFHDTTLKLWPDETDGDRILDQLMFIPKDEPKVIKKIFIEKLERFTPEFGSGIFRQLKCPVAACEIVNNSKEANAIIFEDFVTRVRDESTWHQVWILSLLESPFYTGKTIQQNSVNWTASYRLNSDLVTPYGKWVYYAKKHKNMPPVKNYAEGKSRKIAWFVSNCKSKNKRLEYAKELQKHIQLDIYGTCGNQVCDKSSDEFCWKMMSEKYKFYLSFENANCRDYITEKFFINGLKQSVIPIVMGAPKKDYEKIAPKNSFIHVEDFDSPKDLADYLKYLDLDDRIYNSYFQWKRQGEFINTYFMCRLCAMLHANRPNHHYKRIWQWWKKQDTCTKTFWDKEKEKTIMKSITHSLIETLETENEEA